MQILLNGIIIGGVYALIAIGFNLIFSSVRFYHLLYGELAILGVYLTLFFQKALVINFFGSALIASIVIGSFGAASWLVLYAPLVRKKASSLVLLIFSFGLLIILQNIIALIWKNRTYALSITDTIRLGYQFFGLSITFNQLIILGSAFILMVFLELFLGKTKYGLAIRAIGDNAELTTVLGLKTNRIILLIFFIGSWMSSLGATLVSLEIGVRPTYGLTLVLGAVIASIIGGIGSIRGAFLGGLILGIAENIGIYFFGGEWMQVTSFSLLTIFLLFRPQGLFIKRQAAA